MNDLMIGLCQFDIQWENPDANRKKLTGFLEHHVAQTLDVIILPEMFSTGFSMNSPKLAETMEGPTVQWMKSIARQFNSAICGSVIIQDAGKYFNRFIWCEPTNHIVEYYDKKHLFTLAGEDHHYQAGRSRRIIEYKGWKLAFYICYDLRFPVWSRNTEKADLMIYVANFPEKRKQAWNTLLPARAIENQCYVVGVNRVGLDGNGINHSGDSTAINFEGTRILDLGTSETFKSIQLNYKALQAFKRAYPFLNDDDLFSLIS